MRGRYLHNYGVYRLGENLSWGALPINNDVEGGYYRISYQYARWSWNAGLDSIRSLDGSHPWRGQSLPFPRRAAYREAPAPLGAGYRFGAATGPAA